MCISSRPAHLSKTKILTMPLANGNHFTAYENKVENLVNEPNCMILPIPGRTKPEYFVDTTLYNKFLTEIVQNSHKEFRTRGKKSLSLSKGFDSFELGQYQIGLCNGYQSMSEFILSLTEENRPVVSVELMKFFIDHYHGWSFAVCTFAANAKLEAQPIAYEYKPFQNDWLFYPAMDSHDGTAPKEQGVERDHTLIKPYSSEHGRSNYFTQEVPEFLKEHSYVLHEEEGYHSNSDFFLKVENGNNIQRVFNNKLIGEFENLES
jgi:hypothetical protein